MIDLYFSIFMIIAVLAGIGVLSSKHPITGAVNLVAVMLALAGMYGLLAGPFLGIVQILVYAGAIMMLVVFVIMVLNGAKERVPTPSGKMAIPALLLPLALVIMVGAVLNSVRNADGFKLPEESATPTAEAAATTPAAPQHVGTIDVLAERMFSFGGNANAWFVLFEVVGLVLLVALTGAVLLAKRNIGHVPDAAELAAEKGQGGGH